MPPHQPESPAEPEVQPRDPASRAPHAGRVVALLVAGFLVAQIAWILTTPPYYGIDEIDHAFRASSVGLGHVLPDYEPVPNERGRGDYIPVRRDVAEAGAQVCRVFPYKLHDNCYAHARLSGDVISIASSAARYDPAFYVVTGWASRPFHGLSALYAMRVASTLLSVLLLAAAAWVVVRFRRTGWPVGLFLLAVTPQVLYSASIATPNGLNIVAGLTWWVTLDRLLVADPLGPRDRRRVLTVAAIGGAVLLLTHTLGAVWLVLTFLTVVVIAGPRQALARVRAAPRPYLVAAAVVVLAAVAAFGWTVLARTNDPSAEPTLYPAHPPVGILLALVLWPLQAVAAFPSREQVADPGVYVIWVVLTLVVAVLGIRVARRSERWGLAGLVVLSVAIPLVLTYLTYARLGLAWQGRYGLPYAIGAFVVVGHALDRRPPFRLAPRIVVPAVALVAVAELLSWTSTIDQSRRKALWRTDELWHQPSLLLLCGFAALAALAWAAALILAERRTRVP